MAEFLCSEPSARLLPLVLEDAIRMGITRRRRFVDRLVARIEQQIVPLPYNAWRALEALDSTMEVTIPS